MVPALGWHALTQSARWDVAKLVRDFGPFLRHSQYVARTNSDTATCDEAVFVLEPRLWFQVSQSVGAQRDLQVWAASPKIAQKKLDQLTSAYLLPEETKRADIDHFFVLTVSRLGISARRVTASRLQLSGIELELHYGAKFAECEPDLIARLSQSQCGLTLFQGPPGTGKTSYLRHLLCRLRNTHRFYYLPVTAYSMLADPSSVDFWLTEHAFHCDKVKVVLIEDAEPLLMSRGTDNQGSVSNLLNLADGFLGAYLRLQVICTTNTPIDKLDPAVTRPGRLLASRTFGQLTRQQAQKLAAAKGLTLPDQGSYSLADIYNAGSAATQQQAPIVGFGSARAI